MRDPYTVESVLKLFREPSLFPKAVQTLREDAYRAAFEVNRRWYQHRYGSAGEEFVREDWDNLLVLDAARPDVLFGLDAFGDADRTVRTSPGSNSPGFVREQFVGRRLHDTVYVTANPHVDDVPAGVFHDVVNLLRTAWDADLGTVPPDAVVDAALDAHAAYPNKRLLVHFMQPHYPFLGPEGRNVVAGLNRRGDDETRTHPWFDLLWGDRNRPRVFGSTNDAETVRRAYRENHEIAAAHAEELLAELPGRSVVTADHANLVGERGFPLPFRMFGHPHDFPHPNLVTVPWIEIEGERRDVAAEPPVERDRLDADVVADRLDALGYADA